MVFLTEKPDYVRNFPKPPNTEIKHIKNGWYLYEKRSEYDPTIKRTRKISGHMLGTIKPDGFVPSKYAREKMGQGSSAADEASQGQGKVGGGETGEMGSSAGNGTSGETGRESPSTQERKQRGDYTATVRGTKPNKTVAAGAVNFLYGITGRIRELLKRHFPENWIVIYTIAMIRTIYGEGGRFYRIERQYRESLLAKIYPNLVLDKESLSGFLAFLGLNREAITLFMKDLSQDAHAREYLLLDGTRIITYSRQMSTGQLGYDSKHRHEKQINLMYLVTEDSWGIGFPSYYKQYCGSVPDVSAINDLLKEIGDTYQDVIVVGDKGTANEKACNQIIDAGIDYVFALKRGSSETKGLIPENPKNFGTTFYYNGRAISYCKIPKGDYNIFVYLDYQLLADEMATLYGNNEKKIDANISHIEKTISKQSSTLVKEVKSERIKSANLEKAQSHRDTLIPIVSAAEEAAKKAEDEYQARDRTLKEIKEKSRTAKTKKQKDVFAEKIKRAEHQAEKAKNIASAKREMADKRKKQLEDAQAKADKCAEELHEAQEALDAAAEALTLSQKHLDCLLSRGDDPEFDLSDIVIEPGPEMGTFTLRTSLIHRTGEEVFLTYKQRPIVEQYFKTYDDTLGFDSSYMRNPTSEEGWLFLNHLSAYMCSLVYEKITTSDQRKKISFLSLMQTLTSIRASDIEGRLEYEPITKKVRTICSSLGFDPIRTAALEEG